MPPEFIADPGTAGYAAGMPDFSVRPDDAGLTVDEFLRRKIPSAPPGYLRRLFRKNKVSGADGVLNAEDRVIVGDTLHLPESARLLELLRATHDSGQSVEILYESREILIVDKPSGLAVHTGKGHEKRNLTDQLKALFAMRKEPFRINPVQRLDLETSGPLLFGKGVKSCSELGKLFIAGNVEKNYLALVAGRLRGRGTLCSEVRAKNKIKTATSDYLVIAASAEATLLEIRLQTGRQHQIRQQFAAAGHPLFGDRRYRGPCPKSLSRLFLHCRRLAFIDPFSGTKIDIGSPLPGDLVNFLPEAGISYAAENRSG